MYDRNVTNMWLILGERNTKCVSAKVRLIDLGLLTPRVLEFFRDEVLGDPLLKITIGC